MDNEQNTQNVENQETNEQENTQNAENQETNEQEKSFTQADVDALIKKRLERERSKQPSKEELGKYNEWKKSQQTESEKLAEERKIFESVKAENTRLKNEREVLKSGIDSKYTDYVSFEVSKMEGDFAENLESFIKANPQYQAGATSQATPNNAGGQKVKNEGGSVDYSKMSDAEYYKLMKSKK